MASCFSTPNASVGLYADDSCVTLYSKQEPKSLINEVLSKVSTGLKVNHLSLNILKTYFIKLKANRSKNKVVIDGYTITEVNWVKNLG